MAFGKKKKPEAKFSDKKESVIQAEDDLPSLDEEPEEVELTPAQKVARDNVTHYIGTYQGTAGDGDKFLEANIMLAVFCELRELRKDIRRLHEEVKQ